MGHASSIASGIAQFKKSRKVFIYLKRYTVWMETVVLLCIWEVWHKLEV